MFYGVKPGNHYFLVFADSEQKKPTIFYAVPPNCLYA